MAGASRLLSQGVVPQLSCPFVSSDWRISGSGGYAWSKLWDGNIGAAAVGKGNRGASSNVVGSIMEKCIALSSGE